MEKAGLSYKKGFTLIELLVTIAVMSILLLIGTPAIISQVAHTNLSRSARDVLGELNTARMKALSKNIQYRVVFTLNGSPQADTYKAQFSDDLGVTWHNDSSIRSIKRSVDITAPGGAFFIVEFKPGGSATATDICLQNTSDGSDLMEVQVNGATGRVQIVDGC